MVKQADNNEEDVFKLVRSNEKCGIYLTKYHTEQV